MDSNIDEIVGIDILEYIARTESDNLEDFNEDIFDDLPLSENLQSMLNPNATLLHDIPTNPKEWLITDSTSKRRRPPRLYEFLFLLLEKSHYASYASYKDKSQGIFQFFEPGKIAELWEQIKNRQSNKKMTYEKFARGIRWYYKRDIMIKTNTRHTFQFSPRTLKALTIDENNNTIIMSQLTGYQ